MSRYNFLASGYPITDETITRTSSTASKIGHDLFIAAGFEIWTGAGKTGTKLTLTTDYSFSTENTVYTAKAGTTVYTKLAVVNGAYQNIALYLTYTTVGDLANIENVAEVSGGMTESLFYPYVPAPEQLPLMTAIAFGKGVGETNTYCISRKTVTCAESMSGANPTAPLYFPAIARHDADHDISTAQVPQWVIDKLNSEKLAFGSVSDFTATNVGGVLTFAAGTENTNLLAWVTEQSLVARWYESSEAANYGSLGGLFAGTAQLSVTIADVNYAVTWCSLGGRTIALATAPADGTVTVALYPGRIAGSTTSSRLRRLSGEALVAAGDVTGEVTVGGRRMGKMLAHGHTITTANPGGNAGNRVPANVQFDNNGLQQYGAFGTAGTEGIGAATSDGTNTLVTGKSNDPRTAGMAVYTHLGVVLATNWT